MFWCSKQHALNARPRVETVLQSRSATPLEHPMRSDLSVSGRSVLFAQGFGKLYRGGMHFLFQARLLHSACMASTLALERTRLERITRQGLVTCGLWMPMSHPPRDYYKAAEMNPSHIFSSIQHFMVSLL